MAWGGLKKCGKEHFYSPMIKLEISFMGIHLSCKFGDSVSKLMEVRDVKGLRYFLYKM